MNFETDMQVTPELLVGSLIGLLGSALYGFSVVVYRSQAHEIRPIAVSSIKMWVALPFMAVMVILLPGIDSIFLPLTTVVILGISVTLGAVIGDTIYLWSQERIGVSYAFPISMSFPIITYFLTVIFLGEPPILSRLAGAIIAVIGVVLLSNEQNNHPEEGDNHHRLDLWGIFGAIMTAILYAVGTTLLQVGIEGVDPVSGSFVRVFFGSIAFIPMFAIASSQGMKLPTRKAAIRVIIAGFFGMAVGSLLYVTAVASVGATIMSVISSTAPLFAIPVSVFFLKEKLTRITVIGIFATLVGVILVVVGL
ncbi:MAG: DMT family transporter [Candidatus Thorarchaeota archaeon]|nr:DMT family transporter [Candidatus Thorarchaeota archaeon]